MESKKIVEEVLRRRKIFDNLPNYLGIIKNTVREIDKDASVFLFGSVAEGRNLYSSDIDVLIVSELKPEFIRLRLWKERIGDPFQILILSKKRLDGFSKRAQLVPV
jgi:predicted nucleotidyltransferase